MEVIGEHGVCSSIGRAPDCGSGGSWDQNPPNTQKSKELGYYIRSLHIITEIKSLMNSVRREG